MTLNHYSVLMIPYMEYLPCLFHRAVMRTKKSKVYRKTPINVPGVFILPDNFWETKEIVEIDKHVYYFVITKVSWAIK